MYIIIMSCYKYITKCAIIFIAMKTYFGDDFEKRNVLCINPNCHCNNIEDYSGIDKYGMCDNVEVFVGFKVFQCELISLL